jgi:hypothetical protein
MFESTEGVRQQRSVADPAVDEVVVSSKAALVEVAVVGGAKPPLVGHAGADAQKGRPGRTARIGLQGETPADADAHLVAMAV